MAIRGISQDVLQFLRERIDSVPQLESLLLLWKESDRRWRVDELAARIYLPVESARTILLALQRQKLVEFDPATDSFRYSATWDPRGELIRSLVGEYSRNLVAISSFVHANGSSSVREFARAFDLKKER